MKFLFGLTLFVVMLGIGFFIVDRLFSLIFGFARILTNFFFPHGRFHDEGMLIFGGLNIQGCSLLLEYLLDNNIFSTQGTQLEKIWQLMVGTLSVGGAIFVIIGIVGLIIKDFRNY